MSKCDEAIEQEIGNYNVFCQSCGRIIGLNIDSQEIAFKLEEEHSNNSKCRYTGSHIIRRQKKEESKEFDQTL
jgi:hypothetical protein